MITFLLLFSLSLADLTAAMIFFSEKADKQVLVKAEE